MTTQNGQLAQTTTPPTHAPITSIPTETYPKEAALTAYPEAQSPQAVIVRDPGKTLGVVGLILSVFANVIGLVVSIIALRKSRRAGFKNRVAIAGTVIGLITTLGVLIARIGGGLAAKSLVDTCRELGPGQHVVNGVTYT